MDTFSVPSLDKRSDSGVRQFVNPDDSLVLFAQAVDSGDIDTFAASEATQDVTMPEALLDLTGLTPHRSFDEVEFERWTLGQKMAAKLLAAGQDTLAAKLMDCHGTRTTAICDGCRKRVSFFNRCDIFYCPQCSPRLAKMRLDNLMHYVERMRQPKHIVLTFKNVARLTRDYIRECQAALTRFRRRKFFSGARSGFWAMEITNKGNGWHLHFHLVVDSPFLFVRDLSAEWEKATKSSGYIVYIEDASRGSLKANLPRYVTKYTGKGFKLHEWDAVMLAEFVTAIQGCRTFGVFGEMLGYRKSWRDFLKAVRQTRRMCECGCSSKKYFSDAELLWRDNFTGFDRRRSMAPPDKRPRQFRWRFGVSNHE